MRTILLITFSILSNIIIAQDMVDWNGKYQIQLSDFKSPASQIGGTNIYSLNSGSGMDFSFYMTNTEFMFTKNFNAKVNCTFNKKASSLVAPDSTMANELLLFARFDFDLAELYARTFRKKLYEEKGAFSDVNFFRPIYDDVQKQFVERHSKAAVVSDLGRNKEKIKELHNEVLAEIAQLSDFCKECKPQKKKK